VDHEAAVCGLPACVSQDDWNREVTAWCAARPEIDLVIRAHPAYTKMEGYEQIILPDMEAQKAQLPPNARLILPHEEISTYTLMDLASFCVTYGSTVGLEMACAGLPVVHAGRALYRNAGFTLEAETREDIPRLLDQALKQGRSVEVSRLAYRFAYHYFYGLSHPMNHGMVSRDYFRANLNLKDRAELAPGNDPDLDRLTDYILGEVDLLYAAPTVERLNASRADEDRFLAEQYLARQIAVARANPEQVDLLYQVGLSLRELGLHRESASVFATVIARRPDHAEAQRGLDEFRSQKERAGQAA
jgi:hypothetical protein